MAQNDTLILRTALADRTSIYRDIEIEASKSLYALAEAINVAFDFAFDHAFGFYSGLTPSTMLTAEPRYELFADMGEADPGILSVKRTKVAQAFPAVGHAMMFLFDYGDEWLFRVTLKEHGKKAPVTRYPRVIAAKGEAPPQYPDSEEDDSDGPVWGVNPLTGEKIFFKK